MKNRQFIILLLLNIGIIGAGILAFMDLSEKIDSIEIPEVQEVKNDGNYHINEQEFNRLIYQIEEDAHFCRLGIQSHDERWDNRQKDFTKLFLNTFK